MKLEPTNRGFLSGDFEDYYGHGCSIQKSSIAGIDCIWLGIDKIVPRIMASDARRAGIPTNQLNGWVDLPMPEGTFISGRMHLNQEQVAELLPILEYFVEHGELPEKEEELNI